ncbi:MAG: conjugal transfer protein TraG N-terminal domain-containing protein, partial [Dictyoglomus turgidum]
MKKPQLAVLVITLTFLPTAVWAATWEIVTYGGFDAAVSAWKKVALIFSDNTYTGLFISAAVLGALMLYFSTYIRILSGARGGLLSWTVPVMVGLIVYVAFILPKDSVVIYDQTLNRGPQQIGNIPRGIATLAGLLNKIQSGMTDIVVTSTDPASDYRTNPGGTGFKLLDAFQQAPFTDQYMVKSLKQFAHDCILYEINRSGTNLNWNMIANGDQTYQNIIVESCNPSIYTVYYDKDHPDGQTKTCYEAGPYILAYLNNRNSYASKMESACKQLGFSGNSSQCRSLIDATIQFMNSDGTITLFGAQGVLSTVLMDEIQSNSAAEAIKLMATQSTMSQFIGLAVHAGSWIPVIRESLQAVAVSLVPFLCLFIVTPLVGRAVSVIAGMFVWVTVWAVIDAILHSFGMDLAAQASESLSVGGVKAFGLIAMFSFPTFVAKVAATFGAIRWAGLMLSSIITAMLIKFGGTALAMLAGT